MKKVFAGIVVLAFLVSCGDKKANINPFKAITSEVDSVLSRSDTLRRPATPEEPRPIEADESFDDFIYSFASDETLQRQRIKFPLPYYSGNEASKIDRKYWKHDRLFTNQSYYSLLFDSEEEMDLVGDPSLTSVQVEWFFMRSRMTKCYRFERAKGAWMLEEIHLRPIEKSDDEDFYDFYIRFSTDSLFQGKRVRQPLTFVTADPDDDFSVLETTLDLNQWFAFKPTLPVDKLSNINYGQKIDGHSQDRILALKGVGNGFSNILYFRKNENKEWELYKFEDVSI